MLEDDGIDRGLVQLIIQADIGRQFEFVQKEWMHGGEFMGLQPVRNETECKRRSNDIED